MIPAPSERFRDRLAESRRPLVVAQVLNPGRPPVNVEVLDGQVTADRTRSVRYNLSATLNPDTDLSLLSATRSRLRVWVGVDYSGTWVPPMGLGGDTEWLPACTVRVDDVDDNLPRSQIAVTGLGLEAYVQEDEFLRPEHMPNGYALTRLTSLIGASVPGGASVDLRVPDQFVAGATWDTRRWGGDDAACQMLARACGADVYADAYGQFVVSATPGIDDQLVGAFVTGPRGSLIDVARSYSREGSANVVVATSSGFDGGESQFVVEWDKDPYSPTFLHRTDAYVDLSQQTESTFGRAVLRVSSPLPAGPFQLSQLARSYLADSRGLMAKTGLSVLPDPTVEPGDVRLVETTAGLERQVIEGFSLPLAPGAMSLTCRSTRIE